MKKHWVVCLMIAVAVIMTGCGGNIRNVDKEIGESELYESEEIEAAMEVVLSHFSRNFEGCAMTDLWYDEGYSQERALDWAKQYNAEEAIVLLSNFDVDATGGNGSLNPNSTYEDWNWILVKNGAAWELKTCGYG